MNASKDSSHKNRGTDSKKVSPWSREQEMFAEDFLIKASKRLLLEQQASLYYQRRHYYVSIPSLIIGTVTTGASFSNWSNQVLCEQASWVWLVVASLYALTTILNSLTDHVLNYKTLSAKHHETYKGLSRLIKTLSQELNNPRTDRQLYRDFMEKVISEYNHYTDESELIPRAVSKIVNKMLENAQKRQDQKRILQENWTDYFPAGELPPDYASPGVFVKRELPRNSASGNSNPSPYLTPSSNKVPAPVSATFIKQRSNNNESKKLIKLVERYQSPPSTPRDRSLANDENFPAESSIELQMLRTDERPEGILAAKVESRRPNSVMEALRFDPEDGNYKSSSHSSTNRYNDPIVPHDIVMTKMDTIRRQSVMECVNPDDLMRLSNQKKEKDRQNDHIWVYVEPQMCYARPPLEPDGYDPLKNPDTFQELKNFEKFGEPQEESNTPEQIIEIVKSETQSPKRKRVRRKKM